MNRYLSFRQTALTVALLGIVSLVVPQPAAQADPFHTHGSYVEASFDGNTAEGTLEGRSAPGGAFVGGFSEAVIDEGNILDGTATLDFGNGDTLTFDYVLVFNSKKGRYLGIWTIQDGTGNLIGTTGGGDIAVMPNSSHAHRFWLDGEISQQ